MISDSKKLFLLTTIFTFLSSWVAGGPLLAGKSLLFKYVLSIGGIISGMFFSNYLWSRLDKRKRLFTSTISLWGAVLVFVCVALIIISRLFLTDLTSYNSFLNLLYFCLLFFLTSSTSALSFFAARARRLFKN